MAGKACSKGPYDLNPCSDRFCPVHGGKRR